MKASHSRLLSFNVIYEIDEDGCFIASVPSLAGCYTQGKTLEEAKKRIVEVIKLCLDDQPNNSEIPYQSNFMGIDKVSFNYA
jgi:predicted RNase H-like HicB family nuclease